MRAIITKIAEKHGLDLMADQAHLKLTMESMMPLVIEKVDKWQVTVTHYYYQNGDACADPDMKFFMQANYSQAARLPDGTASLNTTYDWVPLEITQVLGYRRCATLDDDQAKLVSYSARAMREIASFAAMWAMNIRDQHWLERGVMVPD